MTSNRRSLGFLPSNSPFREWNGWSPHVEANDRIAVGTGHDRLSVQARQRRINDRAIIENPLAHLSEEELVEDVKQFARICLPSVDEEKLLRAARVGKDIRSYDEVARSDNADAGVDLPVQLTEDEKRALRAERDVLFSERGMFVVILTVSLAAFLQGHVQSSINGASLYTSQFGLGSSDATDNPSGDGSDVPAVTRDSWKLGAANACPYLFAGLVGCPLSLPVNDLVGRRGAMAVAAVLIISSSLGSAFVRSWYGLFGVRVINGIAMGIKAVSTPILASETAVGFWRGSSILAWQLWVAFGIMIGFVFNLIFTTAGADQKSLVVGLILGAPCVPALILLVGLYYCPESPRYYMRPTVSRYNPEKAYAVLCRLRNTELQAMRDVYLVYKAIQQEDYIGHHYPSELSSMSRQGILSKFSWYMTQYKQLFQERRLRNACICCGTVALAQQLCGINILAFYSGTLFTHGGASILTAMRYSIGFGCINFLCGLPAIRTIDTLGRRKWLILTLPFMCIFMLAAALSFPIEPQSTRVGIVAMWLFLHAAAYSPGLGPIPFTLASESFPLSHREAGCSFAISVNLTFAGILAITFPSLIRALGNERCLGLFSGFNLLALVLVFLLVEETKRRSLEDLDWIFAVSKRKFMQYQLTTYLPWFVRRYLLGKPEDKPSLYDDRIWGEHPETPSSGMKAPVLASNSLHAEEAPGLGGYRRSSAHLGVPTEVDELHA